MTLKQLEASASRLVFNAFIEMGTVLYSIQSRQLFLASGYSTFRSYVDSNRQSFGFGYKTAERCITAVLLCNLIESKHELPTQMWHILPLKAIHKTDVNACWIHILKNSNGRACEVKPHIVALAVSRYTAAPHHKHDSSTGTLIASILPGGSMTTMWHTPEVILLAARTTMGTITLDPCSDIQAQIRVRADEWYTVEDDGLDTDNPWHGMVFVNPPYGLNKQSETGNGLKKPRKVLCRLSLLKITAGRQTACT